MSSGVWGGSCSVGVVSGGSVETGASGLIAPENPSSTGGSDWRSDITVV